ncbi:MAG: hypothetical protein HQ546_04085, partial [Planctomycetes bacterium]|nr:hypothetical protein [Planctomycetota bacterium]
MQDRLPGTVPNPAPQESDISTQVNDYRWIEDNADYDWWYGCAPTAIGMLTAYWDHWYKLSNVLGPNAAIFPGNSTGWLYDAYPSFSTDNFATPDYANGVVAGWSHAYQSLWDGENWIAPNWENHVPDSIADFIATDNGTTAYADIPGGLVKFMAWDDPRTPENESWSVQTKKDDYDSPTGVQLFLDRIDNGEPVILLMESYKDDGTGVPTVDQRHVALGVGGTDPDLLAYNDETVWLYTTWNSGLEEWEWATKYNDQGNLRDLDDWEGESHSGYEFFIVGGITMTPPTQSTSGLSGYFALAHENIGEIQSITIGLGDPDHPDWESGNQKTGVGANCVVTDIDLSAAEAYLHPGEQENWFLKIETKTNATLTGQVMDFQIRYGGEMRWFTSDADVTFGVGNNVAVARIIIDANNGIFSPVSGTAWEDLDANGQMDADEPGLSGWEIHAYEDLNANGVQDPTEVEFDTTTDPDGIYTLSGLTRGYYVVAITPPAPGYVCTLPSGGTYTVKLSGNAIDGVDFGMVKSGQIQGTVQDDHGPLDAWAVSTFRDIDGDGQFNPLTEMSWEATTGIDGTYAFADLLPGDYVVSQVLLDGWAQTTPADGSYNIAVAADAIVDGIDFDNVRLATIEGQVNYEIDTNGDGDTSDTDEKGTLEGWTVYLDVDRNGQLDAGEVSTVTGVGGAYSFVGLAGGLYRANVIVPTTRGWVAVTPSSASRDVSVPAGQTVTAADFLVSYPYN